MKKKSKILWAAGITVSLLLIVGLVLWQWVLPVTYTVDETLIAKNPDYRVYVVESGEITSLVKSGGDARGTDEAYRVLCFTDLHLDHYKERGDYTLNLMIRNIVEQKPDLLVFDGDIITSSFNRKRAKQFCRVLEELGVYWTCTLGNHEHDNFFSMSRRGMLKLFASYPHCLVNAKTRRTEDGKKVPGIGNYAVNLLNSDGYVSQTLLFLDGGQTMTKAEYEKYFGTEFTDAGLDYDYVKPQQITWYREVLQRIEEENGEKVTSTLFLHIPLPEYAEAYEQYTGETEVALLNRYSYPVGEDPENQLLSGLRRETVNCSGHNSGLFDVLLAEGSTKTVVAGHDHVNDFILTFRGVTLAYCETGGYSSYNVLSKKAVLSGETLIQGCSLFSFDAAGNVTIETLRNADRDWYGEYEEGLMQVIRK